MDKYDPNSEIVTKKPKCTEAAPQLPSDPISPYNFYRELVQFSVFTGVVLFPIYVFFDAMTVEIQTFLEKYIYIVKDGDRLIALKVDRNFARVVVICLFIVAFTILFFIRHSITRRHITHQMTSESPKISETGAFEDQNNEIKRLKLRIQKDMMILRTIHNQVYDDNKPRLNYASTEGRYYISANGDLRVQKNIILRAEDKEGPFWTYYATGDTYSQRIENIEDLNFSVAAEDERTQLAYIPLENEDLRKKIAVYFLPLLQPTETRAFKLYYEWPGNFLKLLKTGNVSYDWQNRSYSSESLGDFYAEWIFDEALGEISCQNTGSKPTGLNLYRAQGGGPCRWIFEGKSIPLGNLPFELTFATNR